MAVIAAFRRYVECAERVEASAAESESPSSSRRRIARELSAVCTHLGCLVRWNDAESTWDVPVTESRFTPDGSSSVDRRGAARARR